MAALIRGLLLSLPLVLYLHVAAFHMPTTGPFHGAAPHGRRSVKRSMSEVVTLTMPETMEDPGFELSERDPMLVESVNPGGYASSEGLVVGARLIAVMDQPVETEADVEAVEESFDEPPSVVTMTFRAEALVALRELKATVPKPMGIVLEECDEANPSSGVQVASIDLSGNAAEAEPNIFIGDRVLQVNGQACAESSFEEVCPRLPSPLSLFSSSPRLPHGVSQHVCCATSQPSR